MHLSTRATRLEAHEDGDHPMRPRILLAALALSAPLALAPAVASASCEGDKTTGTILGGVGGALIGNSLARGGGGAVLGGVGGALIGRSIAGSNCRHDRYAYRSARYYGPAGPASAPAPVYYDQFGDPVGSVPTAYAGVPVCHTEIQSYYDQQGALVRAPVRVCAR
jgi:hypothetical protein